nr:ribosome biogenesis GTPase Der [bacterium]
MAKPLVAVVGRPNVGKSTLFNKLVGKRISIVEDTPGVTRDRIYADCEWLGRHFTLVDTGGIDPFGEDELLLHMKRQAQTAISLADIILLLVDGKEGLTPADIEVAGMLRRAKKPVMLVVNKVDTFPSTRHIDFYELGLGEPIPVSAANQLALGDLLDEIVAHFPQEEEAEEEDALQVAIVGRPNAGKSSITNALLGEYRVIVSNIPGTTRDAIDTPFEADGQRYVLIDTAGIRRKARIEEGTIERYGVLRSLQAIRRCQVAVLVIDATQGVSEQDARIAGIIEQEGKACVLCINKWDLMQKQTGTMEQFDREILSQLQFISWAPRVYLSAKTGQRMNRLIPQIRAAYAASCLRVATGVLNDCVGEAVALHEPPAGTLGRTRFYYATQVSACPPTFVFKVNHPENVHFSYLRYLENHLRKTFPFEGTPIRLILRGKDEKEG